MAVEAVVDNSYPVVQLEIADPPGRQDQLSFLIRGFLCIGSVLLLFGRTFVAGFHWLKAALTVLFTGHYPEDSFNYMIGFQRFATKVMAYVWGLTDQKPSNSMDEEAGSPVHLHVQFTPEIGRWRPLLNYLLAIPVMLSCIPVFLMGIIGVFVGWLTVLFTGRYPEAWFHRVKALLLVQMRLNVFIYAMTEVTPPYGAA